MEVLRGCLPAVMRTIVGRVRRALNRCCGGGMQRVTVRTRSVLSGKLNEMDLIVDPNALERWLVSPRGERPFLRDAFPNLSDDEREFLLSGSTPDEWDMYFGEDT